MLAVSGDGGGLFGDVLRLSVVIAFVGSALLTFIYFWRKGRLDMDDEPAIHMVDIDEEKPMEDEDEPRRED